MRFYRYLLFLATLLAFGVIALGAYVRLSDAGLGCPDWPGCYGHLIGVPEAAHEQSAALEAFPGKPVETHKAWKEMLHRYFAGALGLLIALIAGLAWKHRHTQSPALPLVLLCVVCFQALLGMWTVTLLLKPVIVSAHLLGGMTTLALLVWLLLGQSPPVRASPSTGLRLLAVLALFSILIQITLGGWVSSNYAALICTDFPTCLGTWVPEMDFEQGFQIRRELGQTASGEMLPAAALTAIHWSHRAGALIVALLGGALSVALFLRPGWRLWGTMLGVMLASQIGLGIANILQSLPLNVAVAHNAGAALLLALTMALNFTLWQPASENS